MKDKIFNWLYHGPKNRLLYYLVYIPIMMLLATVVIFLLMGVLPELIAWAFGFSCLIWAIAWPAAKIYELIAGRKIL